MNERAVAMKLVLSGLNQPDQIESLQDRKRLQKLVYLAQVAGINLGYRFGWYIRGPYSSELANDYYNMPDAQELVGVNLVDSAKERLARVGSVIESEWRPQGLDLADWLEAVASFHFLKSSLRLTLPQIMDRFNKEKPHLAGYVDAAREAAEQHLGGQA